jgi:hypothetical protein
VPAKIQPKNNRRDACHRVSTENNLRHLFFRHTGESRHPVFLFINFPDPVFQWGDVQANISIG